VPKGQRMGSVALSVFRPNRSLISLKKNCQELLNATESVSEQVMFKSDKGTVFYDTAKLTVSERRWRN